MKSLNRVTRASATLACAIAVVGAASASASAPSKVLPRGAKVVAKIAIPPETGGLAVGEGAVWAMSRARLPRTPAERPRPATAPSGSPCSLTTRSPASIRKRTA
jgi:hypothetical protein